jgi:hypothetical protein
MADSASGNNVVELQDLEVSSDSEKNVQNDTCDKIELSPENTEINAEGEAVEPVAEIVAVRDWKQKFISAAGYNKGEELMFWIGIGMDLCFFCIWLILIFTVLDAATRNQLWWMPLLGIVFLLSDHHFR